MSKHSGKEDICHCKACVQARVDAMKEGMRRAAKVDCHGANHIRDMRQAILTAAEQLTEKDL